MIDGGVWFFGFAFGYALCWFVTRWKALYRHCCREHYATHVWCPCRDCTREREEVARDAARLR